MKTACLWLMCVCVVASLGCASTPGGRLSALRLPGMQRQWEPEVGEDEGVEQADHSTMEERE